MKNIIQAKIYKGIEQYVAECIDLPIVTQGKTLDEVTDNLKEALELFEDESVYLEESQISKHPSFLINYDLGMLYGQA